MEPQGLTTRDGSRPLERSMRSLLRCAPAILALLPALPAQAGAVNLRWSACWGDGGTVNRQFACDTNSGSDLLVGSFSVPAPVTGVLTTVARVNLAFAGTSVPDWWQFRGTGACRSSGIGLSATPPAGATACADWADGGRDAVLVYRTGVFSANTAQLEVTSPVVPGAAFDLAPGHEYFAFTVILNHQKTVGAGPCAGCPLGACMGFMRVTLTRVSPAPDYLLSPSSSLDQVVTWQGGAGIAIPDFLGAGFTYCPGATPTRSSTWGAVKSLYR